MSDKGWYGVDLDATLARYDGWVHHTHIGEPIPLMVERVQLWLRQGKDVRIMTARVAVEGKQAFSETVHAIRDWCKTHIGKELPITNCKDMGMIELWDDRARQVVENTGEAATDVAAQTAFGHGFRRAVLSKDNLI